MAEKKTLWEINEGIKTLAEQIDELVIQDDKYVNVETGEVFELDIFDRLNLEQEEKMKNCLYVVKRMKQQEAGMQGQVDFIQKQLDVLKNRLESMVKKRKWFEGYLIACTKGESWKAQDKSYSCYTSKTPSVVIIDEKLIPMELITVKTNTTPDRIAIKKLILSGKEVKGAKVVYSESLVVK